MSEDDRYRIESRLRQQGRGLAPTPEDIEALKERQRQAEKLLAQAPERPFDDFLPDDEHVSDGQNSSEDDERGGDANDEQAAREAAAPPGDKAAERATKRPLRPALAPGTAQRAHEADAMQALLNRRLMQKKHRPPNSPERASFFASNLQTPRPTKK